MSRNQTLELLTSKQLGYHQKVLALAGEAERTLHVLNIPPVAERFFAAGALCDMGEGNAPYRPRYVMTDVAKFVQQGSTFLKLSPPRDLDELLSALQILYYHIPSITSMPVYLGDIDGLIEPFLTDVTDEEAKGKLRLFLNYLDRTIANGYCHANLGPAPTRAARLILELEAELQNAVPNFTLKYDPAVTPDELAELAVQTALVCANPAICNHEAHRDTYSLGYGVSSCYNVLPLRGGAYTLSRLVLPRLAKMADNIEHFLEELLPQALEGLGHYMNERIRFLVEQSGYFESSFLLDEGLIERDRFVGMFGVAGLCDAVNHLLCDADLRYGRDAGADELADEIMTRIAAFTAQFPAIYSPLTGGRFLLHAQAGLSTDEGVTSGVRIAVGDEPENILHHLRHSARFHRFFPTGCSDIFPFDPTAARNPAALLDLIKGAFSIGDKYCAIYGKDSDLVRITGYLVKRSEIQKYDSGAVVLHSTVQNGSENYKLNRLGERKVRHTDDPGAG